MYFDKATKSNEARVDIKGTLLEWMEDGHQVLLLTRDSGYPQNLAVKIESSKPTEDNERIQGRELWSQADYLFSKVSLNKVGINEKVMGIH